MFHRKGGSSSGIRVDLEKFDGSSLRRNLPGNKKLLVLNWGSCARRSRLRCSLRGSDIPTPRLSICSVSVDDGCSPRLPPRPPQNPSPLHPSYVQPLSPPALTLSNLSRVVSVPRTGVSRRCDTLLVVLLGVLVPPSRVRSIDTVR